MRFREFEFELLRGHAGALQYLLQLPHQIRVGQLRGRQVHRQFQIGKQPLRLEPHPLCASLVQNP